jgi:NAD+ synthase
MRGRGSDIAAWIKDRVHLAGAGGIVVGLSGGIDSAVVARLAQMGTGGNVLGVVMPCHSDPGDEADALAVASHFGLPTLRVDLGPTYDQLIASLRSGAAALPADQALVPAADQIDIKARVPLANIKPRLRMTTLYFVANTRNYLVAGTGNRSELTIGYFTKYGDGGVDLLPIGHLLKSEVQALARDLDVPDHIIEKPPSAGLWVGQTDEDDMGFSYADLEKYLTRGPDGVAPALALRIERLVRATAHKGQLPPAPPSD